MMLNSNSDTQKQWISRLCLLSVFALLLCIIALFYCFRQLNAQSDQMVEILSAQNGLIADYHCEVNTIDAENETISFSLSVIPKVYKQGMEALFITDSGIGMTTLRGDLTDNNKFTCEILSELTDSIVISVVFITGELEQTEILARYEDGQLIPVSNSDNQP